MNPFDYSKAVADFWTAQGQALMKAQQQAGAALAHGMKAVASGKFPMMPEMPLDFSKGANELAQAGKSLIALWAAAASMSGKLATTVGASPGGDGVVEATFRKIADPRSWMGGTGEMDDVLGRMAQGPRFADLWEAERRYAGVLQAWINLRRRSLEHNAVVLQAWLQAARRFTEQLAARTGADANALDAKAALAVWIETANTQLLETQRSDAFLQTQAAMIRATTELRMAQQELVEHFGKQYGFPTRTELDDVHRTVTELRRELRAMRRELKVPAPVVSQPEASKQLAASPETPRTPRPTTRSSSKKRGTRRDPDRNKPGDRVV
jgi:polyhydroxyalkanoate synthase subunit PhaE